MPLPAARTTAPPRMSTSPPGAGRAPQTAVLPDRSHQRWPRKRIVHVSLGTNVGGMEKLLVEFARFTDRERFEVVFISLEEPGTVALELESLRCPVYALGKGPGLRPGVVFRLARLLRALRPSVVHTHNTAAFLYGASAARLARVPRLIHTRHGQRYGASRRETLLFRLFSRLADRMISVSEDGLRRTLADGIGAARAGVIWNGVDLSRFSYTGPQATGPAISVSRLSPEKDLATLIRAMRYALDLLGPQSPGFALEIVGDGSERPQLERLSRDLGLGTAIRFHGTRGDVAALLADASMFVLPSLTEGISLTLLEAMARGLPVVATGVGGNPEVVVPGVTGLLVPVRDPAALAIAMVHVYQRPELGQQMGLRGRQRVEREFSVQTMIRQYEAQYVAVAPS